MDAGKTVSHVGFDTHKPMTHRRERVTDSRAIFSLFVVVVSLFF